MPNSGVFFIPNNIFLWKNGQKVRLEKFFYDPETEPEPEPEPEPYSDKRLEPEPYSIFAGPATLL